MSGPREKGVLQELQKDNLIDGNLEYCRRRAVHNLVQRRKVPQLLEQHNSLRGLYVDFESVADFPLSRPSK